ncbi:dihydrofolate reductase [Schistosoma bovis]|uniref:Dihydrofolate reductase n=1 Tax=Schistosoma bovis TaxID=6184 RepID=A0A430Q2A5_SCHBO|nr:dihydrofolate reductase [Schistosoma bovis]
MEFFKSITTKAHPVLPIYNLPSLSSAPPRVQIVPNLNAAIDLLYNEEFSSIVDEVFIIGGHRLYEPANIGKISYSMIGLKIVKLMSSSSEMDKKPRENLPDIPAGTFTENGFTYKFCVYDVPSEQFI